jgi:hypothetical protein
MKQVSMIVKINLINMEWFNQMSNMDKYFFILTEGILILMFLFMLPTFIKTIKDEIRKYR